MIKALIIDNGHVINPSQIDLAYMAGIFDGEGSVWTRKTKDNQLEFHIQISNTVPSVLDWMINILKIGSIHNAPQNSQTHYGRKMVYVLVFASRNAFAFGQLILPYTIIKHDKLNQAIIDYINYTQNRMKYRNHFSPIHTQSKIVFLEV